MTSLVHITRASELAAASAEGRKARFLCGYQKIAHTAGNPHDLP